MRNFEKLNSNQMSGLDIFFKDWLSYKVWNDVSFGNTDPTIPIVNFKNDHFCSEISYKAISDYIINYPIKNVEETLIATRKFIWDNHLFNGDHILTSPIKIGTVVIRDVLVSFLFKSYRSLFSIPEDVEEFLVKDPKDYNEDEKKCLLKSYEKHIWVTWDENDSNLNPFEFSSSRDRREICDALGLSSPYFKPDIIILLIIFDTIPYEELKKPTIADANFNNDFWRPTNLNFTDHGLTKPISNFILPNDYNSSRPEAVIKSEQLNLGFLTKKIDNYD